jgi:capsular exopolysaccharide synthesis family protein
MRSQTTPTCNLYEVIHEAPNNELELRDYLGVVRRRRAIIALATIMVMATALVASFLQTPVYQGTAQILLQPRSTESPFDEQTGERRDPERAVQTEIEVMKSEPVRAQVKQLLGAAPKVSAGPVGETDVIEIRAQSTNPQQAAAISNAYANAYIGFRRKQAVDDVLAASTEIQRKVTDLQAQIDAIRVPAPTADNPNPTQPLERQALIEQQLLFKQRLSQLQVDAALKTGGAQLVTSAQAPTSPIKPTPIRSGVVALAVGLMFGVGLAFLFEYLDDTIKGKEDLERATQGLPAVGLIPTVPGWKERKRPVLVSVSDSKSPAAEAYRSLRTSVQFMGLDKPLRAIQVTSPGAGEGKTTTTANLAVALAQASQKVVIVSCDLRRPRLHEFFGVTNDVGFTSVLLGDVPVSSALQSVVGIDDLKVVASGPIPPNPSELLAGRRAVEALAALQAEADIVLIDSPPTLPVTDAAVLANRVDGTLLVATAGLTTRRELHRAHEVLRQVDARLLGTVLNGATGDGAYGYTYGYQYAYAQPESNGRRGRHAVPRV